MFKDIIEYWKENPLTDGQYNYYLKPENCQYYNCMIAGFRHNANHHHI